MKPTKRNNNVFVKLYKDSETTGEGNTFGWGGGGEVTWRCQSNKQILVAIGDL